MNPRRVCLINMPFASPEAPSIALTQLKSVLDEKFAGTVSVEVLYLDLDFLEYTGGLPNYQRMTSGQGRLSGAADWFFREAAFPLEADNTEAFLERFYFDEDDEEIRQAREFIREKRPGVGDFLDRLIDRHHLTGASIVGFTSLFFQTMASFAMARRIKERNREVVTVIGGAACETEMGLEFARRVEPVDYVFSGPALVSFPDFVEKQLSGDRAGCDRIDGVFSKMNLSAVRGGSCHGGPHEGPGETIRPTGEERNINANVPLNYHAFLDRFEATFPDGEVRPMLLFETSRGCSWGEKIACTFCGLNGMAMHYRSMTPENALSQLEGMFDYRDRCNFFLGVDTIVPADYFGEVFPKLNPPRNTALMYEVRPHLSEPQIKSLCDAGVLVIQPGIESLSTSTLKLMRKGSTAFGNIAFLKRCNRHPLRIEWNLLIGSPGESEATWEKTLRDLPLLAHLHPPGGAFPISFDRFSQYFNRPEDWDLELKPHEYYEFTWPFGGQSLEKIAYHFVDQNAPREEIDHWLDRLNGAIGKWRDRWENRDGRGESRLCLAEDGDEYSIYDSRTGDPVEFPVSQPTARALNYLDTPRRFEQFISKFGEPEAHRELAFLREKRLLFEENNRLMSLVIVA